MQKMNRHSVVFLGWRKTIDLKPKACTWYHYVSCSTKRQSWKQSRRGDLSIS